MAVENRQAKLTRERLFLTPEDRGQCSSGDNS